MTGHFTNWIAPMMSAQVFGALPARPTILLEAEIGEQNPSPRSRSTASMACGEKLQAAGVTFVDDIDRGAFRDKTRVVYEQFEEWTPEDSMTPCRQQ